MAAVDIPSAIFIGWEFEDAHVRHDKPPAGTFE